MPGKEMVRKGNAARNKTVARRNDGKTAVRSKQVSVKRAEGAYKREVAQRTAIKTAAKNSNIGKALRTTTTRRHIPGTSAMETTKKSLFGTKRTIGPAPRAIQRANTSRTSGARASGLAHSKRGRV